WAPAAENRALLSCTCQTIQECYLKSMLESVNIWLEAVITKRGSHFPISHSKQTNGQYARRQTPLKLTRRIFSQWRVPGQPITYRLDIYARWRSAVRASAHSHTPTTPYQSAISATAGFSAFQSSAPDA